MKAKYSLVGEIADFDYHGNWGDFVSPKSLREALKDLHAGDEIEIEINSPGGSVIQGVEMANLIKNSKAKATAHVIGLAASMASVIACACDEIQMEEASFMMIHDPWSYAEGNADEMRKTASLLDQMKAVIMSFYRGKFKGRTDEEISALMSDETWYTGAECVANGLECTLIKSDVQAAASVVGHKFDKIPEGAAKYLAAKEVTGEGKAEIEAARQKAIAEAEVPPAQAEAASAAAADCPPSPSAAAATQSEPAQAATPVQPAAEDWEARYKGASKKINELNAKLDKLSAEMVDYGAVSQARDALQKQIDDFNGQVKAAGFESLAALIGAVSGFKADLDKSAHDLADSREQLEHMKQTRDLLTGSVLSVPTVETYADKMAKAKTAEEREQLRAMKRAGKIQ